MQKAREEIHGPFCVQGRICWSLCRYGAGPGYPPCPAKFLSTLSPSRLREYGFNHPQPSRCSLCQAGFDDPVPQPKNSPSRPSPLFPHDCQRKRRLPDTLIKNDCFSLGDNDRFPGRAMGEYATPTGRHASWHPRRMRFGNWHGACSV